MKDKKILFSGDIDLTGFGPWYGNINSDVDDFIDSINKIIELKPQIILSAHKGLINDNIENHLNNYLNKIYENENKILEALKSPLTLDELINKKIFYRKWKNPLLLFKHFEKICLIVHLRRLLRLNLVIYTNKHYHLNKNTQLQLKSS